MRHWYKEGKVTSMEIERELALIKCSAPNMRATVERHSASGFLSEWNLARLQAGGRDMKCITMEELVSDHNAPLWGHKLQTSSRAAKIGTWR